MRYVINWCASVLQPNRQGEERVRDPAALNMFPMIMLASEKARALAVSDAHYIPSWQMRRLVALLKAYGHLLRRQYISLGGGGPFPSLRLAIDC